MNQLVAVGTYTVVLAYHVVCWVVVVVVVDAAAPLLLCVAILKHWQERLTHHLLRLLYTSKLEECRSIVDVLYKLGANAARLGVSRIADDKRGAERLLIHKALVKPSVLAHIESLVGCVYYDGVVGQAVLVEIVEYTTHALVNTCYYRHIVADVYLILPVVEVLALELSLKQLAVAWEVVSAPSRTLSRCHTVYFAHKCVVRVLAVLVVKVEHLRHLEVLLPAHVLCYQHLLCASSRATCGIVVVEGLRHWELNVVVHTKVLDVGLPVAVRSLVVEHKAEWLALIALVHKLDCVVGCKVGAIAFLYNKLAVRSIGTTILWVPVLALVVVDVVVVESLRIAAHVPLAYNTSLIACLLKQLCKEHTRCVDTLAKLALSVLVAVKTCHQTSARRCRERVLDKRLVEAHTTLGNTVDVRCRGKLRDAMSIGTDTLKSMVVAHYIHNVRTLSGCLLLRLHSRSEARQSRNG